MYLQSKVSVLMTQYSSEYFLKLKERPEMQHLTLYTYSIPN